MTEGGPLDSYWPISRINPRFVILEDVPFFLETNQSPLCPAPVSNVRQNRGGEGWGEGERGGKLTNGNFVLATVRHKSFTHVRGRSLLIIQRKGYQIN